jgi:hypothetical protein
MSSFQLQRLGMLMEPEPGNPNEIEGVLNPAAARGPDGKLYLFPRLVAKGDYSRIGIARVKFNGAGDPSGVIYHGVSKVTEPGSSGRQLCYSAGVMVLSKEHPRTIRYRSGEQVLTPELPQERHGTVANVVFPTGIDRRDDLGLPDRFDVYYGMADNRIGVARLELPNSLPFGGVAAQPKGKI